MHVKPHKTLAPEQFRKKDGFFRLTDSTTSNDQINALAKKRAATLGGELGSQLYPDFRGNKTTEELIILSDLFQREN